MRVGKLCVVGLGVVTLVLVAAGGPRLRAAAPAGAGAAPTAQKPRVFKGVEAKAVLAERFKREPKLAVAAGKARARLKGLGYQPTEFVVRIEGPIAALKKQTPSLWGRLLSGVVATAHAQTARSGEGAITFWSWNDGNPRNWEGEVLIEDYRYGVWQYLGEQIFVDGYVELTWAEEYGSGGNPYIGQDGIGAMYRFGEPGRVDAKPAVLTGSPDFGVRTVQSFGNCACTGRSASWWERFHATLCWQNEMTLCWARRIPAAAGSCAVSQRMYPGSWPACVMGTTTYDTINCALDLIRSRITRCGWSG